jgi:hypothetical protein
MPEGTNAQHMKKMQNRGSWYNRPQEPKKQKTLEEFWEKRKENYFKFTEELKNHTDERRSK